MSVSLCVCVCGWGGVGGVNDEWWYSAWSVQIQGGGWGRQCTIVDYVV